ncbi:MAG: hypothetical protein K2X38_07475 [Gemmataceae bacterium]|nr:hypothetical protein [Gemmataceae bacterium]
MLRIECQQKWLGGILGPDSLFPWSRADVSEELRWELYYGVDLIQLRQTPEAVSLLAAAAVEPDAP